MNWLKKYVVRMDLIALLLIASVGASLAYRYTTIVSIPHHDDRVKLHDKIIAGSAGSPYQYRVLVPLFCEAFRRTLRRFCTDKSSFLLAYAVIDLLAIFMMLGASFAFLRIWFSSEQALIGVLFEAGTLPVTFQNHFFQPWSMVEGAIFPISFLAIYYKRRHVLAFLVPVAALVRETAVFIPLAYLASTVRVLPTGDESRRSIRARDLRTAIVLLGLWAVVFFGLRCVRPPALPVIGLTTLLKTNTSARSLVFGPIHWALFLGGFWYLVIRGYRAAPEFLRTISWIIPAYLATIIIWGVWIEVRLLIPLYSLFLALGLSSVFLAEPLEPMPSQPVPESLH